MPHKVSTRRDTGNEVQHVGVPTVSNFLKSNKNIHKNKPIFYFLQFYSKDFNYITTMLTIMSNVDY
jgi:anthranilate phosphoribosyltransferase